MVDTPALIRSYLLTQTSVTSLLGAFNDDAIYVGPLPTEVDADAGCAITIEGAGGLPSNEINVLVDDRLKIEVWGPTDGQLQTRRCALTVLGLLAGSTMIRQSGGTIVRVKAAAGLTDLVDPDTKWTRSLTFYMVMAID